MKFPSKYWLFVSDKFDQRTGITDLNATFPRLPGVKKAVLDLMDGEDSGDFFDHTTIHLVDSSTGESWIDAEILQLQ